MAQYTIRTPEALALVAAAAGVGLSVRFVKQDREFFVLQARKEGERVYSHVYDDTDFESVASTLQGMINELAEKEEEAATIEAKPVTNEQIATAIQSLEENLALMVATRDDVLTWDKGFNWVISHGGVDGLYLNASGFPTGICFAQVWSNEKIHEAIAKAKTVVNGEGKQGKVCDYLNCLNRDIQAMEESIATIKALNK